MVVDAGWQGAAAATCWFTYESPKPDRFACFDDRAVPVFHDLVATHTRARQPRAAPHAVSCTGPILEPTIRCRVTCNDHFRSLFRILILQIKRILW